MREKWNSLTMLQRTKLIQVFKVGGFLIGAMFIIELLSVILNIDSWLGRIPLIIGVSFISLWDFRDVNNKKPLKRKVFEWSIFIGIVLLLALIVFLYYL